MPINCKYTGREKEFNCIPGSLKGSSGRWVIFGNGGSKYIVFYNSEYNRWEVHDSARYLCDHNTMLQCLTYIGGIKANLEAKKQTVKFTDMTKKVVIHKTGEECNCQQSLDLKGVISGLEFKMDRMVTTQYHDEIVADSVVMISHQNSEIIDLKKELTDLKKEVPIDDSKHKDKVIEESFHAVHSLAGKFGYGNLGNCNFKELIMLLNSKAKDYTRIEKLYWQHRNENEKWQEKYKQLKDSSVDKEWHQDIVNDAVAQLPLAEQKIRDMEETMEFDEHAHNETRVELQRSDRKVIVLAGQLEFAEKLLTGK